MPRAVATAATRERLRGVLERVSTLTLEPHTSVGSVLLYGPEGYQAAALLRESLPLLAEWAVVVAVADEPERASDWSLLEVLNQSLARFAVNIATPLSAPGTPDDPAVVGRNVAHAFAGIDGPVCIIVENMHCADDRSTEALRFGMRRHGRQPQLVVASSESLANPSEQVLIGLAQTRPERNAVVRLPALSAADVQEIAVEHVGSPLAGRVARRFVADTEGNPTLVSGLLDAYRDEIAAAAHPAAVDLDRGRLVPLLPRQQRALAAASQGARRAAEVVAVLREPTAIATVNRIAAWLEHAETFGAFDLEAAERAGLVRFVTDAAIPTVTPPSRVAGDRIAAAISIEGRRQIHSAAADILTGLSVLRHRIGAMDPEDTTLVGDLLDAARTRAAVGDSENAMSLTLSAVRLAQPGAEYERAVLFAGILALRLHEHQRVFHLKGDLAALPASQLRDAVLADLEVVTGSREAGIERARRVVRDHDGSPTARALAAYTAVMTPLYAVMNDHHELVAAAAVEARQVLAQAPRDPREVHPELRWLARPAEYELWLTTWELVAAARLRDARTLADRMSRIDALLRGTPDSPAAVDALVYQARTFLYAGRVTDAANRLHRAIRVAGGYPDSWMRYTALTIHAHVLFMTGEWESSLITGRMALDSAFDDPYRAVLPTAYAVSGLVPAARGEVEKVAHIDRMLTQLPPLGGAAIPYDPDLPDVMRAELAAAIGDPAAQLRATETARVATRRGSTWSWLSLYVDALLRLGRTAEAIGIANEALSGRTPWNRSPRAVSRLRARVALASGDLAQANELYAGVVQSQTASGQPFSLARDRLDYAEALQAGGDTAAAVAQLELAASTFRSLAAGTHLMRVLERIAALSEASEPQPAPAAVPVPVPAAPADADAGIPAFAQLTARERQVAVAVASGLTNREVAERLYVSVTTVNFHVRNILAKLSLSSRRELRAILHGSETPPSRGRRRSRGGGPVRS